MVSFSIHARTRNLLALWREESSRSRMPPPNSNLMQCYLIVIPQSRGPIFTDIDTLVDSYKYYIEGEMNDMWYELIAYVIVPGEVGIDQRWGGVKGKRPRMMIVFGNISDWILGHLKQVMLQVYRGAWGVQTATWRGQHVEWKRALH